MKLLVIGPMTNKKDPSHTGGTVVLFELLLRELERKKIFYQVIDINKSNYSNNLTAIITILSKYIWHFYKYKYITLHGTAKDFIFLGPFIVLFSKLFNKKIILRKFAGNFDEIHLHSNKIKKNLIEYVLKNSSINFFETKYLVDYFSKFNVHTYWFPNVRSSSPMANSRPREYKKRFIFIGSITKEKGIDEIVEVAKMLNNEYTIDLYGPIIDKKYSKDFFEKQNINYKGSLISTDVIKVMNQYDVLLLPSYREGYPGVIIEALSLGIPSIATRLEGIMEMIEDKQNGLLINVKNSEELKKAMMDISEEDYSVLSGNALESFTNFDSSKQTNLFLTRIGINV